MLLFVFCCFLMFLFIYLFIYTSLDLRKPREQWRDRRNTCKVSLQRRTTNFLYCPQTRWIQRARGAFLRASDGCLILNRVTRLAALLSREILLSVCRQKAAN